MDLFFKIFGLVFMLIAGTVIFSLKKEVKNFEGHVLDRNIANRWTKLSKMSTILMAIGCILTITGLILSI